MAEARKLRKSSVFIEWREDFPSFIIVPGGQIQSTTRFSYSLFSSAWCLQNALPSLQNREENNASKISISAFPDRPKRQVTKPENSVQTNVPFGRTVRPFLGRTVRFGVRPNPDFIRTFLRTFSKRCQSRYCRFFSKVYLKNSL